MLINFDHMIDRRNTGATKWDNRGALFGEKDILPMWIADMDFPSPAAVAEAVKRRAGHPIFGYTEIPGSYNDAVIRWMKRRNGWAINEKWIVHTPGVVTSIKIAILAYTDINDKILIQSPVYYPFYSCITSNDRQLVVNPLKLKGGAYRIDFDDLEDKLRNGVKMMILCSPHNPVGRVWEKEELNQVAGLCIKYNVLLLSDEIHSDLIYDGSRHIPAAALSEEILQNSVTCISPTKTFNLAGLAESMAIIPNSELRSRFQIVLKKVGADMLNIFGAVAAEAAYTHGEAWLEELMDYLSANMELILDTFRQKIPSVKVIRPEGTYLAWMDCREIAESAGELKEFFARQAGVGLSDGAIFGKDGAGFQRMNFACPRSLLTEGLQRIEDAVLKLKRY